MSRRAASARLARREPLRILGANADATVRLALAVALLYAVGYALLVVASRASFLDGARVLTARAAGALARAMGAAAVVTGTDITVGGRTVAIVRECLPLETLAAAVPLVALVPGGLRRSASAALAALLAVLALNVVRIAVLSVLLARSQRAFDAVHTTVAPALLPLGVFAVWLFASRAWGGVPARGRADG